MWTWYHQRVIHFGNQKASSREYCSCQASYCTIIQEEKNCSLAFSVASLSKARQCFNSPSIPYLYSPSKKAFLKDNAFPFPLLPLPMLYSAAKVLHYHVKQKVSYLLNTVREPTARFGGGKHVYLWWLPFLLFVFYLALM